MTIIATQYIYDMLMKVAQKEVMESLCMSYTITMVGEYM